MAEPVQPALSESEVYLRNPSGEVVAVPKEQAEVALRRGFTPAGDDEAMDFERRSALEKEYGGVGGQLATGAAAAARAATFGLSDAALTSTGAINPQTLKDLQEVNPTIDLVGTGVGIVAPALLTGGATAAATGAKGAVQTAARLAPTNLVARVGAAAERVAARALPQAETAVGQILRKGAEKGIGSAVEGAFFTAGEVVSEQALGSPDSIAESLASKAGLGIVAGGAVGGVFGAGGGIVSRLAEKAGNLDTGKFGASVAKRLSDFEAERAIKAAGGIQSDIKRIRQQVGREGLDSIGREMVDLKLVGPFTSPDKTHKLATDLLDDTGAKMGYLLKGADADMLPEDMASAWSVLAKARREIVEPLEADPFQREAAARITSDLDALGARVASPDGRIPLQELHATRRRVDDALYGMRGNLDPFANKYRESLHKFRGLLNEEIDAGIQRAGHSTSEWKALRRKYQVASTAQELAEKGIDRADGNNLISLTELMSTLGIGGSAVASGNVDIKEGAGVGLGALVLAAGTRRYGSGVLAKGAEFIRKRVLARGAALESATEAAQKTFAAEREKFAAERAARQATRSVEAAGVAAREAEDAFEVQANAAAERLTEVSARAKQARQAADLAEADALKAAMEADRLALPAPEPTSVGLAMEKAALSPAHQGADITAALAARDLAEKAAEARRIADAADEEWQLALGRFAPKPEDQAATLAAEEAVAVAAPATARVPEKVRALAEVERAHADVGRRIKEGVRIVVAASVRGGRASRGEAVAGISRQFASSEDSSRKTYEKRTERILAMAANPEVMLDHVVSATDELDEHAPGISQSLKTTEVRAITFLASKIPQRPPKGALGAPWKPSKDEISKFNRYYEVVQDPMVVLKQAAAGNLSKEAVEAIRAVFPDTYNRILSEMMEKVAEHGRDLPYRTKLMLSFLSTSDLDGTTSPEFIRAIQAGLSGPSARSDSQSGPTPTAKALGGLTFSSRSLTPDQEAKRRR